MNEAFPMEYMVYNVYTASLIDLMYLNYMIKFCSNTKIKPLYYCSVPSIDSPN